MVVVRDGGAGLVGAVDCDWGVKEREGPLRGWL